MITNHPLTAPPVQGFLTDYRLTELPPACRMLSENVNGADAWIDDLGAPVAGRAERGVFSGGEENAVLDAVAVGLVAG